ncbi:unnamed protein product [Cuscuta epithymum]|uniref:DUF1985 domain-containing protein n=1 Tax=Cuscuta epithymum TaxID=186058 RepID=A0AAV0CA60_9ASTE|nr:unnamed protein product [Cuscuta epithymum]
MEAFNSYPWGRDIWDDLVNNAGKSVELLTTSSSDRVTFPGFMFAVQVWAFETLTGLNKAGVCVFKENQENAIPRTLKWSFTKKQSLQLLCKLIFHNNEFEYKPMEPTAQEMEIPELALLFQNFEREHWQFDGGIDCSEEIQTEGNDKGADCNEKEVENGSGKVEKKKKSRSRKGAALQRKCTRESNDDEEDDSLLQKLVKKTDMMMEEMARIKNIQRTHGSLLRKILTRLEGRQVLTDEAKEVSQGEKQCIFEKDDVVLHDKTTEREICDKAWNIEIDENGTEKDEIGEMDVDKGDHIQTVPEEVDDAEELLKNDENKSSNEKEAMAEEDGTAIEKENVEVSENEIDSQRPSFNIFGFSSQEEGLVKKTDEEILGDLNNAREPVVDGTEKMDVGNDTGKEDWRKLNDDDTDYDEDELLKVDELVNKTIEKRKEKSTETNIEESTKEMEVVEGKLESKSKKEDVSAINQE